MVYFWYWVTLLHFFLILFMFIYLCMCAYVGLACATVSNQKTISESRFAPSTMWASRPLIHWAISSLCVQLYQILWNNVNHKPFKPQSCEHVISFQQCSVWCLYVIKSGLPMLTWYSPSLLGQWTQNSRRILECCLVYSVNSLLNSVSLSLWREIFKSNFM